MNFAAWAPIYRNFDNVACDYYHINKTPDQLYDIAENINFPGMKRHGTAAGHLKGEEQIQFFVIDIFVTISLTNNFNVLTKVLFCFISSYPIWYYSYNQVKSTRCIG